jgi:hypothetical protein
LYWRNTYGASQEAFVILKKLDGNSQHHSLMLKVQNYDWGRGAILVSYDARNQKVTVESRPPNASGWTTHATIAVTLQPGDKLSAVAAANGTVRIYVNGVLIGNATVNSYFVNRGGSIGVWFHQAPNAEFDNFGGGNASP